MIRPTLACVLRSHRPVAALLLAVILLGSNSSAGAVVELTPIEKNPAGVRGQILVLSFTDEGRPAADLEVTAIYRENAHESLRHEQLVGVTDAGGHLNWTPEAAGVVVLQWAGGAANLSVAHPQAPFGGVFVAVFAGVALLGGSALFFLQMLRQREPEIIEETEEFGEPPST